MLMLLFSMSNDAFDHITMHDKLYSFGIKYLQFYYKHIISSEKNKPSNCATDGYLTFIIRNDH